MIDIQKFMVMAMKGQLFVNEKSQELNIAARQVLGEMKTKMIDIKGEITNEIQYKMLQKMKKDRENAIKIYIEAFEKTSSDVAKINLEKAKNELEPIDLFLMELEANMPKKMSEDETTEFIKSLIQKFGDTKPNKGMIMKLIKSYKGDKLIDMAMASKIISNLGF